eukprot:tig00001535_g9286.t1
MQVGSMTSPKPEERPAARRPRAAGEPGASGQQHVGSFHSVSLQAGDRTTLSLESAEAENGNAQELSCRCASSRYEAQSPSGSSVDKDEPL